MDPRQPHLRLPVLQSGMIPPRLAALAIAALAAITCSPSESAQSYDLRGQILAVRADANQVLIKHEDIVNFMPGMTMPFTVRDRALLDGKAAGDLVTAQLRVSPEAAWIARLDKTGHAPLPDAAAVFPAASLTARLAAGEPAPATTLHDQHGRPFSLADWRGSAVVVTFIYTRCPLPQFCPLLDRRFIELQRAIKDDVALAGRARLLSVSFDPDYDTPARLAAHANRIGADPALWRFATAPAQVVDVFAAAFGVSVLREADQTISHNLRTVVIGSDGRVVEIYDGSNWMAADVVGVLRRSLTAD